MSPRGISRRCHSIPMRELLHPDSWSGCRGVALGLGARHVVEHGVKAQVLLGGQPIVQEDQPDPAAHGHGCLTTSKPATDARPTVGRASVHSILTVVVFPHRWGGGTRRPRPLGPRTTPPGPPPRARSACRFPQASTTAAAPAASSRGGASTSLAVGGLPMIHLARLDLHPSVPPHRPPGPGPIAQTYGPKDPPAGPAQPTAPRLHPDYANIRARPPLGAAVSAHVAGRMHDLALSACSECL